MAVNDTSNERSALETVMPLDYVFSPCFGQKVERGFREKSHTLLSLIMPFYPVFL
jgi:hypothetical protein